MPFAEKDVTRTDRTQKFFSGDKNPNLQVLYDILMTYGVYNFDLGEMFMSSYSTLILILLELKEITPDLHKISCFIEITFKIFFLSLYLTFNQLEDTYM